MSQISFNLFFPKDKRVLSEFPWKWGWFQEHNERFSKYLPKSRISKNRHGFLDERALKTTTLISSCHWKTRVPFCLQKKISEKGVFNTNSELPQNHTGKQIMPSKTTINCLFNDIWCYLFIIYLFMIHCWKIGFFQQTVVRFY